MYPFLFVVGMSEKVFPAPARDDRIYSEAESRSLQEVGCISPSARERNCDEMLLFYEVVTPGDAAANA